MAGKIAIRSLEWEVLSSSWLGLAKLIRVTSNLLSSPYYVPEYWVSLEFVLALSPGRGPFVTVENIQRKSLYCLLIMQLTSSLPTNRSTLSRNTFLDIALC